MEQKKLSYTWFFSAFILRNFFCFGLATFCRILALSVDFWREVNKTVKMSRQPQQSYYGKIIRRFLCLLAIYRSFQNIFKNTPFFRLWKLWRSFQLFQSNQSISRFYWKLPKLCRCSAKSKLLSSTRTQKFPGQLSNFFKFKFNSFGSIWI